MDHGIPLADLSLALTTAEEAFVGELCTRSSRELYISDGSTDPRLPARANAAFVGMEERPTIDVLLRPKDTDKHLLIHELCHAELYYVDKIPYFDLHAISDPATARHFPAIATLLDHRYVYPRVAAITGHPVSAGELEHRCGYLNEFVCRCDGLSRKEIEEEIGATEANMDVLSWYLDTLHISALEPSLAAAVDESNLRKAFERRYKRESAYANAILRLMKEDYKARERFEAALRKTLQTIRDASVDMRCVRKILF